PPVGRVARHAPVIYYYFPSQNGHRLVAAAIPASNAAHMAAVLPLPLVPAICRPVMSQTARKATYGNAVLHAWGSLISYSSPDILHRLGLISM
ncbi:MAG: hypothetical protein O6949_09010, partial [Chloroflexi bacterium]|nr:hypothetical protein [Chloroflexota bacterium]